MSSLDFFITPSQKVLFKLHTLDVRNAGHINFFSEKMRERPHLHIKCNFCSEYDTPVYYIEEGGQFCLKSCSCSVVLLQLLLKVMTDARSLFDQDIVQCCSYEDSVSNIILRYLILISLGQSSSSSCTWNRIMNE